MKILLVGEYSRLHNSLKEGLIALGHEVTLVSTGDYFKKFPSDILLKKNYSEGIPKKIKVAVYRIFGVDISSISLKNQFFKQKSKFVNFDIVQLINESAFGISPKHEIEIISFFKKNNKKLYLLSCGTDYTSVTYAMEKKFRYSICTPFFEEKISKKEFAPVLKYVRPSYKKLHEFVFKKIDGVIASDLDYHIPLLEKSNYLGLIPNPVNTENLKYSALSIEKKIIIFHGINRGNYFKKGNDYFEEALAKIKKKYPLKVDILTAESVPYAEYMKLYEKAHIVLDQVHAYDQGYNALEAMARGKVVFTGAETEFLDHYNLQEDEVCINALPNVTYLVEKLTWLIENPEKIETIGQHARQFIEREHDYVKIAEKYIQIWNQEDLKDKVFNFVKN